MTSVRLCLNLSKCKYFCRTLRNSAMVNMNKIHRLIVLPLVRIFLTLERIFFQLSSSEAIHNEAIK
jgi:hypothetical protein